MQNQLTVDEVITISSTPGFYRDTVYVYLMCVCVCV